MSSLPNPLGQPWLSLHHFTGSITELPADAIDSSRISTHPSIKMCYQYQNLMYLCESRVDLQVTELTIKSALALHKRL